MTPGRGRPWTARGLSRRVGSAKARRNPQTARVVDDPPLYPPGNGLDLGAADALQDLVRDRGACRGRAGGAWRDPEGRRQDDLGQGQERHLRCRADRRDRARNQARRHRLPHPSRRDRRPRGALRAPGHDLLRRARHLPQRAAHPRRRHPDRRYRQGPGGAEEARLRAQDDADHRPLPRHPCRAGDLRAQARFCLCGIFPRPRAAGAGAQGGRDLRDLRRRSAPSRRSTRASKSTSRRRWALCPSRSRPR